jgi:hypothetical protein
MVQSATSSSVPFQILNRDVRLLYGVQIFRLMHRLLSLSSMSPGSGARPQMIAASEI